MHTLGVDPAQRRDFAGLALLDGGTVRWLERSRGLSYPDLAGRVQAIAAAAGGCAIVLDVTGVGRGLADILEARGLAPTKVSITAGGVVKVTGRELSVPKRALIGLLARALERGQLRVAPGVAGAELLAAELLSARDGAHPGDLLVAVALALYHQAVVRLLPA